MQALPYGADPLTGTPVDHGMHPAMFAPGGAGPAGQQAVAAAAAAAGRPADHVDIEKSNVLILVRERPLMAGLYCSLLA